MLYHLTHENQLLQIRSNIIDLFLFIFDCLALPPLMSCLHTLLALMKNKAISLHDIDYHGPPQLTLFNICELSWFLWRDNGLVSLQNLIVHSPPQLPSFNIYELPWFLGRNNGLVSIWDIGNYGSPQLPLTSVNYCDFLGEIMDWFPLRK